MKRAELAESKIVVPGNRGIKVVKSVTIRRPATELYAFWRELSNLSLIIKHPVEISPVSGIESHWSVSAPGKDPVEWDAVIINDEPDQLIAWRSRDDAEVPNAGSVRFETAPGDEGTEVTVKLEYDPPGGKLGALVAKLTGDEASQQVADALRRFKALFEAGEIPTTEGQPVGEPQRSKQRKEAQS
ncbi:MAG TPA: SRPBCC family protein [Lacunisphaera sp.]|nr:SRPBCC family protein [Lacunisphaera sp.]